MAILKNGGKKPSGTALIGSPSPKRAISNVRMMLPQSEIESLRLDLKQTVQTAKNTQISPAA
jgi:hypothetical protein